MSEFELMSLMGTHGTAVYTEFYSAHSHIVSVNVLVCVCLCVCLCVGDAAHLSHTYIIQDDMNWESLVRRLYALLVAINLDAPSSI